MALLEVQDMLLSPENFMMGEAFDSMGISSYLHLRGLVADTQVETKRSDGTNLITYELAGEKGSVTMIHNPYFNTTQIRLSLGVPRNIATGLQNLGTQSREKRNFERYGVQGVA